MFKKLFIGIILFLMPTLLFAAVYQVKGKDIAIVNLQGRVFMRKQLGCPLHAADSILSYLKGKANIIFVDFHAKATSEKMALAYYFKGRVSGIVSTHTHIQAADKHILPKGTAYITDLGMGGTLNSMIGMQKEGNHEPFSYAAPCEVYGRYRAPQFVLAGAWIDVDAAMGQAVAIERIRIIDESKVA